MKQPSSSQHTMPKSSEEMEHLLPKVEHLVPQLTETRVVDVADAFYQLEPHPDPSSVLEVSSVDSAALCPFTTYTAYFLWGIYIDSSYLDGLCVLITLFLFYLFSPFFVVVVK